MHFAAFAYVGESVTDPARYYENNVGGTMGLLKGMREADCKSLVFSSTCATYGEQHAPITETTPQNPVNPYGRTKLICEGMLADYARAYDLANMALRYFNAGGDDFPSPDGRAIRDYIHVVDLGVEQADDRPARRLGPVRPGRAVDQPGHQRLGGELRIEIGEPRRRFRRGCNDVLQRSPVALDHRPVERRRGDRHRKSGARRQRQPARLR